MKTQPLYTFQDFHRDYKICNVIGQGKFGEVFRVLCLATKTHQALKIITCKSQRDVRDVQREI